MKIRRMDHVGIVVEDLAAAKIFFLALGFEVGDEFGAEGEMIENIIGLKGVKTEAVMVAFPDGGATIELIKFHRPLDASGIQQLPANTLGIRHLAMIVEDIEAVVAKVEANGMGLIGKIHNYENTYKLCYCHGPEGIILEFAEELK